MVWKFLLPAAALLGGVWGAFAQSPPANAPDSDMPTIKAGAEEVMIDVIARDKKGQPVTNLTPADLELYDNGVKRKISSFRLIEGNEDISATARQQAPAARNGKPALSPLRQIRLVTLIFNRLSLNSRNLSRTAALDLLRNEFPQNVYMAVLVLGDSLQALQPFTNDRELLKKAVTRATSGAYTEFIADSQRIQQQLKNSLGPATTGGGISDQIDNINTGGGGSGAGGAPDGGASANAAMAQMMLSMLQLTQRSELAQTGRSAIFGLMSAVEQQYRLPGRKSILFFSEGFGVPQGMEEPFRTLISTANRFNVTFYSIDARGLNTNNLNDEAVSQLRDATSASRANFRKGGGQVTPAMANALDTATNSGKANTQNTLAELAESTGGFLIANTNDFRDPLRKVSEDIETYYEITYNPGIENYDGSFRKVELKSGRAGVRLQSRAGYYALPFAAGSGGNILAPYELPLLQALSTNPPPRPIAFQATGLHFRGSGDEPACSVVLDVPLNALALQPDASRTRYLDNLEYLILVKNAAGQVVQKFRGDVPLAVPAEQLQALRSSHFIYTQHFDLPPGRYTLESAILDGKGAKTSARKSIFVMPPRSSSLGLSSVTVVRNLKEKSEGTSAEEPFLTAGKLVTPTLNPVIRKADGSNISFFFVIYPDGKSTVKPQVSMQFSRDGERLGNGAPALGEPDSSGKISYVAAAPVAALEPGNYDVRFVVKQGIEIAQESVTFAVE